MKSPPSPEKERAGEEANPNRHDETNQNDTLSIAETSGDGNYCLLARYNDVALYEFPRGRNVHYEVVAGAKRWSYGLFFFAEPKYNRAVAKTGGER
jgi:hypothetical protein